MKINIEEEKLYSIDETSSIIGVTDQTVAKYLRIGKLKGEKKGPKKKWFVKGNEIKNLMTELNMF